MAAVIEVEDLYYRYRDGTQALQGLTLTIPTGARVAILGPNGAGKSTFLLHLNGIYLPQQGKVRLLGRSLDGKNARWAKSQVGLVFQDPDDQVFAGTVWEDVCFGPVNMGLDAGEVERRAGQALRAVGMEDLRTKAPHHLSYGQKKRVAIAGVLAMSPSVIVLDEPMAYLDPRGKDNLLAILTRLHRDGTTVVVATHDVDMAAEWAEKVIIIKEGRTLAEGSTDLLTDPALVEAAELRFPVVTQIFRRLGNMLPPPHPKRVEEAAQYLRTLLEGHHK